MSELDVPMADVSAGDVAAAVDYGPYYYMDPNVGYYYDQPGGYYDSYSAHSGYDYYPGYPDYSEQPSYETLEAPASDILPPLTPRDPVTYDVQDVTVLQHIHKDVNLSNVDNCDVTENDMYAAASRDVTDDTSDEDYEASSSDSDESLSGRSSSNRENRRPNHKTYLGVRRPKTLCKSRQRHAANVRERKRMKTINDAFELLRVRVPSACEDRKLSKVDTLKMAIKYIGDLTDVLKSCGEDTLPGLKARCNNRITVIYSPDKLLRLQADDNQSGDLPLLIYGHSLSWEDSRDRVTVVNNRLRAPVWTPSVATAEDIAEMPPDPTGT